MPFARRFTDHESPRLRRFFSRKVKPRIFLNSLKVVPKSELGFIEKWIYKEYDGLEFTLSNRMAELITLPRASSIDEPRSSDLAIDLAIPKYETGEWGHVSFGETGFPLFWRPRIEIVSRLFELESDRTLSSFSVVQKMPWPVYFCRIFTVSSFFRIRSPFRPEDFEYVLSLGLLKLIDKMRKSI